MIDLTPIFHSVITLIAVVITFYIVPFVKKKLTSHQLDEIKFWTSIAVRAAEQIWGAKAGSNKIEYVKLFLESKGYVLDMESINALIESEVHNITNK